jgi:cobalt-precorrin 5A hydrolase
MDGPEAMSVIAGIGCRRNCSADDIAAAVRLACEAANRKVGTIAAPAFKSGEPGLRAAAASLGLPVLLVGREALEAAQPRCATVSRTAVGAVGLGSVAEGCALAAAGADSRLVLARVSHGGATCALAEAA